MTNRGVANSDWVPDPFPGIRAAGTPAPGTQGISASTTNGAVVGSPGIPAGDTYQSGQLPRDQVTVTAGDTASSSDDLGAHEDALTPGPLSDYVSDGPFPNNIVSASEHGRFSWQAPAGGS